MRQVPGRVLLIGYGNPGRLDDGLGPMLADAIALKQIPGVSVDANYMLTVEDAAEVSHHDVVVFADASVKGREPFFFDRVEPRTSLGFTSHHIEPAAVLGLAHDLFEATTEAYVLGIRGYEFDEFGQRLSDGAQNNLLDAIAFLEDRLTRRDFTLPPYQACQPAGSAGGDQARQGATSMT